MKILIVDDNADAAQVLADVAEMSGYDLIETAGSGEDAIGKAIVANYDMITLDIRMSGVSGLDALSVIRGLRPHAIIAIISAYVQDMDPDSREAADIIMSKPISVKKLQAVMDLVREISERRSEIRGLGEF